MSKNILLIKQGSTFSRRIEYYVDNQPFNLTNYQARMQLKPNAGSSTVYCTLSSSLDVDGTGLNLQPFSSSVQLPLSSGSIGMTISAASSSMFQFDECYFDMLLISGSGTNKYVQRIFEGKAKLQKGITQ